MTIRLREPEYTGTLHIDLLPNTFSHLNPTDLLIVEIVCKTWHNASISHNELWECVAYRKGIFVDRSLPIRIQVIQSFGPYCKAARKIFSNELKHIPQNLHPIIQKRMIDQAISQMDKTLLDPFKALADHLSIEGLPYNITEIGTAQINECIQMMPVWAETGTLIINEDLFHSLMAKEGYLNDFKNSLDTFLEKINNGIERLLTDERRRCYFHFPTTIENTQNINNAISSLAEYILHFSEKPSLEIVSDLCFSAATIQLKSAWHMISSTYFLNRTNLNTLLANLKEHDWEEAFERFMLEKNIPVTIEIKYPPFLKKILQYMDKTEMQQLIDLIPPPNFKSNHPCILYMHKQIQKNIEASFLIQPEKEIG